MPAVFGAWSWMGGKRCPFDDDSQVSKSSRKYKHGKRVGRRELVEKLKALEIKDVERASSRAKPCPYHSWWERLCESIGNDDFDDDGLDEETDKWEFVDEWDVCKRPCAHNGNHKGVYALNRQAFAIHARVLGRKHKDSDSHLRPHPSSKLKRCAAKKNGRDALRDFEGRK